MRFILLAFLLYANGVLVAQLNGKYNFRHLDQSDGLLHSTVNGIGQDQQGYIWILSRSGLQRYDGNHFLTYPEACDPTTGAVPIGLYVDKKNNQIGVVKDKKISRLDIDTRRFSTLSASEFIKEDTTLPSISFTTPEGNELMVGKRGNIMYEKATHKDLGAGFNTNPDMDRQSTFAYYDSVSGNFYALYYYQLVIGNPLTHQVSSSLEDHPTDTLLTLFKNIKHGADIFHILMLDSHQNFWVSGYDDMLHRYNFQTHKMVTYSLKKITASQRDGEHKNAALIIRSIYEDRQKNLWMATDYAGLLLYNREKDNFDWITSDEKISNGIRYNYSINCIFQDRDDNIWLGTDRGISIFNPYRNHFQSIRHVEDDPTSLPKQDIINFIQTSSGEMLIGTWGGGIAVYDEHWNFIRNIHFEGGDEPNQIWSFVKNDNGTLWVGAQAGIIHITDTHLQSFRTIQPPEAGHSTIVKMAKDQNGNILLGLHNGRMAVWKKESQKFFAYNNLQDTLHAPRSFILSLLVDHSNRCWVGTDYGLFEFDIARMAYKSFFHPGDSTYRFHFQGLAEINDSMLMIGTINEGMYVFNKITHQFSRPFHDLQFATGSVSALKKDEKGNLWLTTNYEVIRFNPDLSSYTRFNLGENALNAPFENNTFHALHDGHWVTTSPAEIICFDPRQLEKELSNTMKVVISGFKVLNTPIYMDSILPFHKSVILPYDQNFITIEFSALNFSNILNTNYYYRLTGIDKDWNISTTKPFADYTDLKPGEYVFEVKANNGSGDSLVTSLPITITPPWWATLWFRILTVLTLAFLGFAAVRRRIASVRHESEWKRKMAETEMTALRSQMNPHFIFNCLNSIDNLIQTDQKEKATTYLSKFALLIRAILENSKSNVIPCWKDLEALKLYLDMEALRWDNKIQYKLDVDPQIQLGDYKVPPMIIQPFVENAIHHGLLNKMGTDKKMDIRVSLEGEQIKYTITDNGVGRMKAAEYKQLNRSSKNSFGMQISEDRISLFNQHQNQSIKITDLYDDQQQPAGTQVEVWLTTQPISI